MFLDMHTHVVPEAASREVQQRPAHYGITVHPDAAGPRFAFAGGPPAHPLWPSLTDMSSRVRVMGEMGAAQQLLSLSPEWGGWELPPAEGGRWHRLVNAALAADVATDPQRFIGCAVAPLQDPAAAAAELERAVAVLGMRAVLAPSNVDGTYLHDPAFDPFWAAAAALGVPVFIHPVNPAGRERMTEYRMHAVVGFPVDTTVAVAYLLLGGVLHRHPRLRLILAHGGGCVPWVWGRMNGAYERQPGVRTGSPAPPEAFRSALWFDSLTHSPEALGYLAGWAGAPHVVTGSDYPFPHTDPAPLATLDRAGLTGAARDEVAVQNARRLLTPQPAPGGGGSESI